MPDPLELLLRAEGSEEEADALASYFDAGTFRTSTVEVRCEYEETEPVTHRFWVQHTTTIN